VLKVNAASAKTERRPTLSLSTILVPADGEAHASGTPRGWQRATAGRVPGRREDADRAVTADIVVAYGQRSKAAVGSMEIRWIPPNEKHRSDAASVLNLFTASSRDPEDSPYARSCL
jgi:hypothetical protein